MRLIAVKKSRKSSGFVIYSCLKDSEFKGIQSSKTAYLKQVLFVNRWYTGKGYLSLVYKKIRKLLDLAAEPSLLITLRVSASPLIMRAPGVI